MKSHPFESEVIVILGADPFLENSAGYTAFDICLKNKCKESEELAKEAIFAGRFQIRVRFLNTKESD